MESQYLTIILLVALVKCVNSDFSRESIKKYAYNCKKQAEAPNFDKDIVIGRPWRIYFTWNVDMNDKCLDFVAKNASEAIVNRVWYDMHKYLDKQPNWRNAVMHTYLGSSKHELLLIDDGLCPGCFTGVPYITGNDLSKLLSNVGNTVPLFKFFLKLLNDKYLLMMDCQMGISTLLCRDRPPRWNEVMKLAQSLQIGEGGPACLVDSRETLLIEHNIA